MATDCIINDIEAVTSKNVIKRQEAYHRLVYYAFNTEPIALDHFQWDLLVNVIKTLVQGYGDFKFKDKLKILLQKVSSSRKADLKKVLQELDVEPLDVDSCREMWKRGDPSLAAKGIRNLLQNTETTQRDAVGIIHTMINDCYETPQHQALAESLETVYDYVGGLYSSYDIQKNIITSIIRMRNTIVTEANTRVFGPFMNRLAREPETIEKAWRWICDALEFARPATQELLWGYLTSWITDPPFSEDISLRDKCMYQFFASEYLLQSHRQPQTGIATVFLLECAENTDYSTFIRGDAMDVLTRNPVPAEYKERAREVTEALRGVREDTRENLERQRRELGNNNIAMIGYRPQNPVLLNPLPGFSRNKGVLTTFDDSQNVHETSTNDAIKESLLNLIKDDEVRGNTIYKVVDDIKTMIKASKADKTECERATMALPRFVKDPSVFTNKRIKLGAVLVMVWNRIINHKERQDLSLRLITELSEAFNTCATGHLSRIVSVLVGYYPDIKQMNSFETQLQDCIKARVNTALRNAPDDIKGDLYIALADSDCPEYATLSKFKKAIREEVHDELYKEFVPEYMSKLTFKIIFTATF